MAKRRSSPNGIIDSNIVWDVSADTYQHDDIKAWLDKFDAAIGALYADRTPLGVVEAFSAPSLVNGGDTSLLAVPTGWALCDGTSLTASQHDLPAPFAGNTIWLPDYRGRVLIGSDYNGASARVAGVAGVSLAGPKGRQGADQHNVPNHFHTHNHSHKAGKVAGVETYHAIPADGAGGGLNDTPANNPSTINTDSAGTGHNVSLQGHAHQLASFYTSQPRDPASGQVRIVDAPTHDGSAYTRIMTSLQRVADGGNGEGTTDGQTGTSIETPSGGAAGGALTVDTYPKSEGVYWIMKVKWGGNYNRPWSIRDSAGSAATVGHA